MPKEKSGINIKAYSQATWTFLGVTSGAGTAYPSGTTWVHPWFLVGYVLFHL
jgi:hypothetical protein